MKNITIDMGNGVIETISIPKSNYDFIVERAKAMNMTFEDLFRWILMENLKKMDDDD